MSTSWYSIDITVASFGGGGIVFSGYFSVDNTTNIIQQFYNSNAIGTNILVNNQTYNAADNKFISGKFTSLGTAILSIPSLDSTYNAVQWLLFTESKKGSPRNGLNYRTTGISGSNQTITGTITFITTLQTGPPSEPPTIPICFPAGTPVETDQGEIAIEKINCKKHTIKGKKIVAITKTITMEDSIVCIEKDALGTNVPSQKTLISRNHKLLYNKEMIKAKHLVEQVEGVYNKNYNGEVLYNVLLETHEKMIVNNLIVETLDPTNIIAQLYNGSRNEEKKNNIIKTIKHCANNCKKVYGKL